MSETKIRQIKDTWLLFEKLLEEDCLQLPPSEYLDENFERNSYFPDYIKEKLEIFQRILTNPSYGALTEEMNIPQITLIIEKINKSIKNFFLGNTIIANKSAQNAITLCKDYLNHLTPWDFYDKYPSIENFYRLRSTTNYYGDIRKPFDLFHCPFEKRYQLKPQRYSVPGIPCLYLGRSIYICWIELDRPNLNHIALTRYVTGQDEFKLIDLSWRPMQFRFFLKICRERRYFDFNPSEIKDPKNEIQKMRDVIKSLYSYLHTWPLLFVCSFPCPKNSKNDYFKPKYLFPQILIQWVTNQKDKFDGIKYFSVKRIFPKKEDYDQFDYLSDILSCNTAIPVTSSQQVGYDLELYKRFSIRKPISYQDYQIKKEVRDNKVPSYWKNDYVIKLEDSPREFRYGDLLFGRLEKNLHTSITYTSSFDGRYNDFFLHGDDFPIPKWKLIDYFHQYGYNFREYIQDKKMNWNYFITMNPQDREKYPYDLVETTKIISLEDFFVKTGIKKPEFLD